MHLPKFKSLNFKVKFETLNAINTVIQLIQAKQKICNAMQFLLSSILFSNQNSLFRVPVHLMNLSRTAGPLGSIRRVEGTHLATLT